MLIQGDPAGARESLARCSTGLKAVSSEVERRLPTRHRANLAMNRSRASVLEAICLAGLDNLALARASTVVATQEAAAASKFVNGRNPVIQRRIGIASRVRLEIGRAADLGFCPPEGLFVKGDRAFRRSLVLSPAEPDTLFEYARFLLLSRSFDFFGSIPQSIGKMRRRASAVLRIARRSSPDHPARTIDPSLQSRSTAWPHPTSWPSKDRWRMMPSS